MTELSTGTGHNILIRILKLSRFEPDSGSEPSHTVTLYRTFTHTHTISINLKKMYLCFEKIFLKP